MRDREDVSAQRASLAAARAELAAQLSDLSGESARAAKAARTKTGFPDLDAVHAAGNAVKRAEEACDTAAYDLSTASGNHG